MCSTVSWGLLRVLKGFLTVGRKEGWWLAGGPEPRPLTNFKPKSITFISSIIRLLFKVLFDRSLKTIVLCMFSPPITVLVMVFSKWQHTLSDLYYAIFFCFLFQPYQATHCFCHEFYTLDIHGLSNPWIPLQSLFVFLVPFKAWFKCHLLLVLETPSFRSLGISVALFWTFITPINIFRLCTWRCIYLSMRLQALWCQRVQ